VSAAVLSVAGLGVSALPAQAATNYDISERGSAVLVALSDLLGPLYPTADHLALNGSGGRSYVATINGTIAGIASLEQGDTITIPITATAASLTKLTGISGDTVLADGVGTEQFTVSYSTNSSTGVVSAILTKNAETAAGAFSFVLNLGLTALEGHGTQVWSVWLLDGTEYSFEHAVRTESLLGTHLSIGNGPELNTDGSGMFTMLGGLYAQLLQGNLNANNPLLHQNYVQVETVTPNAGSAITNLELGPALYCVYGSMSDDSGLDNTNFEIGWEFPNPTTVWMAPDLTLPQIEAALLPGERAVVRNSDGTYTAAVNWGPLVGNPALTYPAGTTVTETLGLSSPDVQGDLAVALAIDIPLAPACFGQDLRITFSDPTLPESAVASVQSNLASLLPATTRDMSDLVLSNNAQGQTLIRVHYVDNVTGAPLVAVDASYGWPSDATQGPASGDLPVAPKVISRYQLVTSPAGWQVPPGVASPGQALYAAGSAPYPLTGFGPTDVFYAYDPVPTAEVTLVKHGELVSQDTPKVGDTVHWAFSITNTGDFPLVNLLLTDVLPNVSATLSCPSLAALAVGARVICTATSTLSQTDIDNSLVANTANVTGQTGGGEPVSDESSAVVLVSQALDGSFLKTVSLEDPEATAAVESDVLTYHFTVQNLGNVTLSQVSISDPMPGLSAITWGAWPTAVGVLLPGESISGTATYTVTAADVAAGSVSNTATVHVMTPDTLDPNDPHGDPDPGFAASIDDSVEVDTAPTPGPGGNLLPNTGGSLPSTVGSLGLAVVAATFPKRKLG
jgi:uncharacterized repeat protein (TIGR01451 family)